MNFDELNNFVVLSHYLNYSKASEALHITQPTLSKCISRLETELGQKLFYRSNRGVALTEYGSTVLGHAKAALIHGNAMLSNSFLPANQEKRTLVIGLSNCRLQIWLPGFFRTYLQNHPDEDIQVLDGQQDFLLDSFSEGRCDLLLAPELCYDLLPQAEKILLDTEPIRMLVSKDSIHAKKKLADMDDFRDEWFIMEGDRHSYRKPLYNPKNLLLRICAEHNLIPKMIPCQFAHNIPLMVACGMGVTIGTDMLDLYSKSCVSFLPIKGHEDDGYRVYGFLNTSHPSQAEQFALEFKEYLSC